jgi:cation transporter-like permease
MPAATTRRSYKEYNSSPFSRRTYIVSVRSCLLVLLATLLASSPAVDAVKSLRPPAPFARPLSGNNKNNIMTSTNDSTVLRELKDTIRNQAKEIEQLKANLKGHQTPNAAASHGGGHGHGGGEPTEEEVAHYLEQPFYQVSLTRVGWLGIFLASLSATAVIMNTFEHTLEKHIELSYFVPLLAGHGGNTGGQTIGTILSAMSSGVVKPKDAGRVVLKEAAAGLMSGIILGVVVSPVAYQILGVSFPVATVLFFTMPLVSTIASSLGGLIPFLCIFMGLDPSVIAAPAMTSFVDICGLLSYFLIANYIFRLYGLEL